MVKSIINVRRSSICSVVGERYGRQKNQKSWLWRHCEPELFAITPRSPSPTCRNPKLKSTGAGRYSFFPVGGMPTASSLAWKTSLRKSQDAVALQQIKGVALHTGQSLVISVRASAIAAISGLHCRALVMVSSSIRLTAWLQKFKEAGGTVREIDVWAESPRLSPLWLSASSSACHGLLIITVITPLPTKPSATKMPENWSWRTRQLLTCRCVSVMLLRSMQNTRRVKLMLKLKMMLCVMMLPLVVVGCTSKQSVSQCVKPPPPPAWIMQPPRLVDTRRQVISPSERPSHYAKTTGRNPEVY